MMKKLLALILSLVMVLSLAACGANSGSSSDSASKSSSQNEAETKDNSAADDVAGEDAFEIGKVENNVYTNNYLGIGVELDSDWTFLSEEEILEKNNLAKDLVDEETKKALEDASVVYDMMATSASNDSISINVENLGKNSYSVDDYFNAQIDGIEDALSSMGIENAEANVEDITFAGSTQKCIMITGNIGEATFEEAVITIKKDTRFVNITISSPSGKLSDIIDSFYAL